jgi:TRAP-type C4-dicarboxylate transport system substrate-binding protein
MKKLTQLIAISGLALAAALPAAANDINLRAIGVVSSHKHHTVAEREFYDNLSQKTGLKVSANFNPLDVVGVNMQDTLRLVRSGTFDIVSTTIGSAARDDAFLEGLDLIGVAPDIDSLRVAIDAYRGVFAKRMEERFNAKVLALWPYGPQIIYCKEEVKSLTDLKGHKVRSFTSTMSALLQKVGATPVTMQFAEVYPALQRGVADCGITSPTSGNTGNWPEVTNYLLTLGLNWSVNGHFMNLDSWNRLSPEAQEKLAAAFKSLEEHYWTMSRDLTSDAISCNTGGECKDYKAFKMKLLEPSKEDEEALRAAVSEVILPSWKKSCEANYPDCAKVWNETIGAVRGYEIK